MEANEGLSLRDELLGMLLRLSCLLNRRLSRSQEAVAVEGGAKDLSV